MCGLCERWKKCGKGSVEIAVKAMLSVCKLRLILKTNVMNLEEKVEIYDTEELSITNVSGSARFIIVAESVSGHCCFEYSVIDTKEGKKTYGDYWKKTMCETFDKDEAVMICYALNQHFR
jgi:hypothetical protein